MGISNLFVNPTKTFPTWLPDLLSRGRSARSIRNNQPVCESGMTVGQILSSIKDLPSRAILLGQCMDELPFLMGLTEPEIGAILIGGDPGCGKTHQIQVMVDSAICTHKPKELQIAVLTHHPEEWRMFLEDDRRKGYLNACYAWYDSRAEQTIQSLIELAEARRDHQQSGSAIFLILDDFNFVECLSYEAQVNLHWLLAYGPQSNVWPIGAINAGLAGRYRYWVEAFRTRIIGSIRSKAHLADVILHDAAKMKRLEPSIFRVFTGTDWLTYRIPLLGD